ncbi:MAG: 5-(carboxyamino)imidazole ribonucleotide synthase [Nitrospirae bacterium]|nr:5-(carboxyamino)imidazole ribonucleotide synthase [Candidatus Troglogloeales bacterium]
MFFTAAARQIGYRVVVWDPHPEAPARLLSDSFINARFNDSQALLSFMTETQGVTYEWENVPADLVSKIEKEVRTTPSSSVLRLLQNRVTQKGFLQDHGFPVVPFYCFDDPEALSSCALALGLPCIVKMASSGYDGQGQWHLTKADQLRGLTEQIHNKSCLSGWVIERTIDFHKELSVIVVRGDSGEILTYPVAENIHEQGILRISRVPANISEEEARRATSLAAKAVGTLKASGVFCVEMFLTINAELLINEIAPRPHNSGHYSMDVCSVSQFEQQVRVLCSLPLIPPSLCSPAILVNILGSEIETWTADEKRFNAILSRTDVRFYHYRKPIVKTGRKMGHLLIINPDAAKALDQAQQILSFLKINAASQK